MDGVSVWGGWLLVGFALLIVELFVPGVFVMWWGLAALLISGLSVCFDALTFGWQAMLFALFAMLFSLLWWKYQHSKDQQADRHTVLNAREHHLIGQIGVIEEMIAPQVIRAKFGDSTWKVNGEGLCVGDKVEVLRVEGIVLQVRKISDGRG